MLNSLLIKNLAIIQKSFVEFGESFNVLTGETGAGKSIIVNAVSLLRGEKGLTAYIRTGADQSLIEAVFSIDREEVKDILNELEIEFEDEIIIRRIIGTSKSKVLINDTTVTLQTLQKISQYLIGIEGQHSQQLLLQPKYYGVILDKFAGIEHEVRDFEELYNQWTTVGNEITALKQKEKDRTKNIDFIKYQIDEIEKLSPKEGEDDELQKEKKLLSQAEELISILSFLKEEIYSSDNAVISRLKEIIIRMGNKDVGEEWDSIITKLEEVGFLLEDSVFLSDKIEDKIEVNPTKLENITERIFQLSDLKRKYGPTLQDVFITLEKLKKELKELENSQVIIEEKESLYKKLTGNIMNFADKLSVKRRAEAKILEKSVERELEQLGMDSVVFVIKVTESENINKTGKDKIEILVSLNKGEELRQLNQTASGGELSRIMLALRVALGEKNPPSTLIFDEIDAGIGGITAEKVGNKLKELSKKTQIIVITHLPQIAILSNDYYTVYKEETEERTFSKLKKLEDEDKINDLARMYGKTDKETVEYVKKVMRVK